MEFKPERVSHLIQVDPDLRGIRLDQAASSIFNDYSRARLQKWIKTGELTIDGQQVKATYRVRGGESLKIDAEPDKEGRVIPQNIPIDLIYSDSDILVVNKPVGLVVHPAAGNWDGTLQNALLYFDPNLAAIPRSGIVHRLDKDTSGVMVVARSLRAHTSLVDQLQTRSMSRIYQALARGEVRRSGIVDQPIGRDPRNRKRMAVVQTGKAAVTHYRVIQNFTCLTHLELQLETGRTHQIRVHLSHLGFAIVGDALYSRKPKSLKGLKAELIERVKNFPRQALHAHTLRLKHPADGREVSFQAPLPQDMSDLLSSLVEQDES
jgi:23S rRNA pseudouridine1911/1915/1917 synthase